MPLLADQMRRTWLEREQGGPPLGVEAPLAAGRRPGMKLMTDGNARARVGFTSPRIDATVGAPMSVWSPQDGAALSTLRDADGSSQWWPAVSLDSTAHTHSQTALDTEAERREVRATMANPVRMGCRHS